MRIVPSLCRCATLAVVVSFLSTPTLAQFGRGSEAADNPFGEAPDRQPAEQVETSIAKSASAQPLCRCIDGDHHDDAVARIEKALSAPLKEDGLQFQETPLESVAEFLQSEYGLPIQIDVPALENIGLSADEPVTIRVRNISLKSALRLLLKPLDLTYVIKDEVFVVTSREVGDSELVVCVYDVRDLASARRDTKETEKLADVVIACIAMETWAANGGGEAEIRALRPGLLVVAQTRSVHDEIKGLFAAMRKILATPPANSMPESGTGGFGERGDMMMGRGGMGMEMGYGRGREGGYGIRGRVGEGYGRSNTE